MALLIKVALRLALITMIILWALWMWALIEDYLDERRDWKNDKHDD